MENAKNSFYIALRDRIAQLNPARTIFVRGLSRPGVLVEENELVTATVQHDAFRLLWTTLALDRQRAMPLGRATCEIRYATAGTANNGGMDRGACLAAMDRELMTALAATSAAKLAYTQTPPAEMATRVFWTAPVIEAAADAKGVLSRTVKVDVYSIEEAGEA